MEIPKEVVLASASPRRQSLLRQLFPTFDVLPAHVDETPLPNETPVETALRLASEKAVLVARLRPHALVIAGDTVVEIDGISLDKPRDAEHAAETLHRLSGREHRVTTAVALALGGQVDVFAETTRVTFRTLSHEEIDAYAKTGEPLDKAGAYAIQGGAAGFVEKVEGSLTNVVGLPVETLRERLASFLSGANQG